MFDQLTGGHYVPQKTGSKTYLIEDYVSQKNEAAADDAELAKWIEDYGLTKKAARLAVIIEEGMGRAWLGDKYDKHTPPQIPPAIVTGAMISLIKDMPKIENDGHYGERYIFSIPKNCQDDHPTFLALKKSLGDKCARFVAKKFVDEKFNDEKWVFNNFERFTRGAMDEAIFHEYARGISSSKVADASGVTARTVRNISEKVAEKTGWQQFKIPTGRRKGK
jgi:hypothetical protein